MTERIFTVARENDDLITVEADEALIRDDGFLQLIVDTGRTGAFQHPITRTVAGFTPGTWSSFNSEEVS